MSTQNPSLVSSPKSDCTDAAFRGALMRDQYTGANQGGFVYFSDLADVARAGDALRIISRLVHNSLSEPEMSDAEPLGLSAHLGLLNAAEVIARYLVDLEGRMRQTADSRARFEAEQEASHG
ncbi:hypothetical protein KEH56_33475 [Burkholderia cenocepacia]|uniref:hypothetical protein n=1 Tax=Burkholderia cenocepacia TaxID=95486 RepID=UPI001BACBC81|nr:hypothetical protein [Burkholderia cenocepacia]QUN44123.1 hypothetical protein KEH56_33475 [Burkholderia cenocepacia]QUO24423.1 hypothetical protein KEH57_12740 [Burkholderia cenocepacia]